MPRRATRESPRTPRACQTPSNETRSRVGVAGTQAVSRPADRQREILKSALSQVEATLRFDRRGPNEIPQERRSDVPAIVRNVVREPMLLLLLAGGGLYLALGDRFEAALLLSVFVVTGITIYQERKAERALAALRDLASPRALVVRDGEQRRIPGREVVQGDPWSRSRIPCARAFREQSRSAAPPASAS